MATPPEIRPRTRRRIRLGGYVFLLILLLVLLAAWNTGTNLFYLVFGGLASFMVVSAALAGYSLRKLHLTWESPQAVHRDARFSVLIRVENKRAHVPALSIRAQKVVRPDLPVQLPESRADDADPNAIGYVVSLPAGREAILRTSECFQRRGAYRLPDIDAITSFPFGLIECRRRFANAPEVVVYPRVLPARTALVEQAEGAADILQTSLGEGDEFFSLREYVPGDDIRRVAWKASARSRNLLVRDLERQTSRSVVFVFDSREQPSFSEFNDHFESAIELIASLAFTLLARRYNVSLVTPNDFLRDGEGQAQFLKLLDKLARIQPAPADAPDPFLMHDHAEHARGVSRLLVSADPSQWGRRADGAQAFVLDPREVIRA